MQITFAGICVWVIYIYVLHWENSHKSTEELLSYNAAKRDFIKIHIQSFF